MVGFVENAGTFFLSTFLCLPKFPVLCKYQFLMEMRIIYYFQNTSGFIHWLLSYMTERAGVPVFSQSSVCPDHLLDL